MAGKHKHKFKLYEIDQQHYCKHLGDKNSMDICLQRIQIDLVHNLSYRHTSHALSFTMMWRFPR
jgi:hypothetical protein